MPEQAALTLGLPPPEGGQPDLLIIAGEHSGDQHAALIVADLKAQFPDLNIAALGGEKLRRAGAQLLFDFTAHSVVGFVEVVKSYAFFKELFELIIKWINTYNPRHLCLVDYPGFNLRLAERLFQKRISRKGGGAMGVHYYISPQIWAWKAVRRFKMERWLDSLGVIFPFEVDTYKDTTLPVTFVGHPFVSTDYQLPVTFRPDAPILLLPGSRRIAVSRILPSMIGALKLLLKQRPDERATIVYPDDKIRGVIEVILAKEKEVSGRIDLQLIGPSVNGKAALTSSGTISLACGLAGIPGAIVYRAHPLTYWFARYLIQVPYLGIANLLLKNTIYNEYIQWRAKPSLLVKELEGAIDSEERISNAESVGRQLRDILRSKSSVSAATWLAEQIRSL